MHSIIVRYSEIGIKGKNRHLFENRLVQNIRAHLKPFGKSNVNRRWGRLEIHSDASKEDLTEVLAKIPGIANFSHVVFSPLSLNDIEATAKEIVGKVVNEFRETAVTFRVTAKRANKDFFMISTEIEATIGAALQDAFPQLKVQLTDPMLEVGIEIWEKQGVVYTEKTRGIGGLPVDDRERVVSLISGGIDSPVASWMIMKRGCRVIYLYFHSFPFIGEQTKEKVTDLVKHLSVYQPESRLYIAPFAEIQKAIKMQTPEKLRTILYRRFMNLIANQIAKKERARAIVTGDALSQVASQTLTNLNCTSENSAFPVLRPLIGMDKIEIMALSRMIGTYPISIQDFPDCCTVFQPANPATKAYLPDVLEAEESMEDRNRLVDEAVEGCEIYNYYCHENRLNI
ncbi:MAG: tRNA 4-thiouridine(8) synthase ThiI [SAR324 cluster bacterium]|nr:tRNA 4-thiouridine(8) synthase ThiI [SAR324 cluster bacterium]